MKSWADELIKQMREQGSTGNTVLQLATMTGETTCRIGAMDLTAEDLLISENLLHNLPDADNMTVGDDSKVSADSVGKLAAGDTVVVYRLTDTKYLILAKVVQP